MKKFSAEMMLQGVCHDAMRLVSDGDTRGAYNLLKNKLREIDTIERSDYARVKW